MKQEFLDFLNALMEACPDIKPSDNVLEFIEVLKNDKGTEKDDKPTKNGVPILKFLQEHQETKVWKAKDIADQMGRSSRGISGAMRKLVEDGYCERMGKDPINYSLTEKGKTYIFNDEEE